MKYKMNAFYLLVFKIIKIIFRSIRIFIWVCSLLLAYGLILLSPTIIIFLIFYLLGINFAYLYLLAALFGVGFGAVLMYKVSELGIIEFLDKIIDYE